MLLNFSTVPCWQTHFSRLSADTEKNKVHASQERIFIHLRHPRSNESKQVVYIDKIKYVDQLLRSPQHVSAEAREFEKWKSICDRKLTRFVANLDANQRTLFDLTNFFKKIPNLTNEPSEKWRNAEKGFLSRVLPLISIRRTNKK